MNYRDYEKFGNDNFRENLLFRLVIANNEAKETSFLGFSLICQQNMYHHIQHANKSTREGITYPS